jgi:multidrug resistance efflux pump
VNKAQELFTVADLSTVWVMASLNEKDFASVQVGSPARITAPAYGPEQLEAFKRRAHMCLMCGV